MIFGISSCLSVEIEEDLGASVTRGRGFPEARSLVDQTDMLTRRTLGLSIYLYISNNALQQMSELWSQGEVQASLLFLGPYFYSPFHVVCNCVLFFSVIFVNIMPIYFYILFSIQ